MWQPFFTLLFQSDGVQQTTYLAQRYCQEAIRQISMLRPSAERDALIRLTEMVLSRDKWTSSAGLHFRQLRVGKQHTLCPLCVCAGWSRTKMIRDAMGVWFGRTPGADFSANWRWIWQETNLTEQWNSMQGSIWTDLCHGSLNQSQKYIPVRGWVAS